MWCTVRSKQNSNLHYIFLLNILVIYNIERILLFWEMMSSRRPWIHHCSNISSKTASSQNERKPEDDLFVFLKHCISQARLAKLLIIQDSTTSSQLIPIRDTRLELITQFNYFGRCVFKNVTFETFRTSFEYHTFHYTFFCELCYSFIAIWNCIQRWECVEDWRAITPFPSGVVHPSDYRSASEFITSRFIHSASNIALIFLELISVILIIEGCLLSSSWNSEYSIRKFLLFSFWNILLGSGAQLFWLYFSHSPVTSYRLV